MNATIAHLRGSMPAMVTPLDSEFNVDLGATQALVDFFVANGSSGIVVLGSSGEFQGIRWSDRSAMLRSAVGAAAGRIPVIAGAGLPNLWATLDQISQAADCGADAALVTPPYYFPIDQDAIVDWFARLAESSQLPLLYYHFPTMTKLIAEPTTVERLRDVGLVGLKDSGGSSAWLHSVLARVGFREDFRVFLGGDGHLLDALVHGASGCIGLNQNVVPHISAQLCQSYLTGDLAAAHECQRQANKFALELAPSGLGQPCAKAVLAQMGLCGPTVAPPMRTLSESEGLAAFRRVEAHLKIPTAV